MGPLEYLRVPEEKKRLVTVTLMAEVPSLFFFNDTATTEIYTLSLHDALPISATPATTSPASRAWGRRRRRNGSPRSEEHTSELQSRSDLVCRLLLEKKKK